MNEFVQKILETLTTNGFPQKKVTLHTEKMYEVADKKGLSFNSVLERLKQDHQVTAEIGPEKITFSRATAAPADMLKEAQELMSKMDPQELQKIKEMLRT